MDTTALLRPQLLDGRVVALGGGGDGEALGRPLAALGARTPLLSVTADEDAVGASVQEVLAQHRALDVLLHDMRPAYGVDPEDPLQATLGLAWITVRAVANAAFIPEARGGRVVLIAPRPDDGDPTAAAGVRAAAENLARTLSIEWARHRITTVAITPGTDTPDAEIAAVAAFLASPAGAYWSGCRMALGELALTA